jgi:hypothetical protein
MHCCQMSKADAGHVDFSIRTIIKKWTVYKKWNIPLLQNLFLIAYHCYDRENVKKKLKTPWFGVKNLI